MIFILRNLLGASGSNTNSIVIYATQRCSTRARFLHILKTIFWVIIWSYFEHSKKIVRETQSWNYQESPWDTTMWLPNISEYWPETNVSSMRYHFKSITQLQIYNSLKNIYLWPLKSGPNYFSLETSHSPDLPCDTLSFNSVTLFNFYN